MKFRVRVDAELSDANKAHIEEFLKTYNSYVLVSHVLPHGNPHYHVYVDAPMVMSDNAMRQRVKRYFKVEKASDYSVKKCDEDKVNEYVQYMFNTKHGNRAELISYSNFDNSTLDELKKSAQDISTDYEDRLNQRIAESKKSRLTMFQLGLEVHEIWSNLHKEEVLIHELTEIAQDVCYKHNQCPEPNKICKIISVSLSRNENGRKIITSKVQNYFQQL